MGFLPVSKPVAYALFGLGLLALAGLGFGRGVSKIDAMVTQAATSARVERDTHWKAEIAASNQRTAEAQAAQAIRTANLEAATSEATSRATAAEHLLEKRNAELPAGPSCGLDRARGRLLDADP